MADTNDASMLKLRLIIRGKHIIMIIMNGSRDFYFNYFVEIIRMMIFKRLKFIEAMLLS